VGRVLSASMGDGVWRTIRGTRVFIPNGQTIQDVFAARTAKREGWKSAKYTQAGGWRTSDNKPLPDHIPKNIPPAWANVQYDPDKKKEGLLVTGVDAKGRRQPIYSESHNIKQAAAKFARTQEGIKKLEGMKAENFKNLSDVELKEEAAATRLIMETGVRPGSDGDTGGDVKAFGATTLEGRHVVEKGGKTFLRFTGKKGVKLNIPIENPATAKDLLRRAASAGDRGRLFDTNDARLRDYVKGLDGGKFKTKDLRTIVGTSEALKVMKRMPSPSDMKDYKKAVKAVATQVSTKLGNTPTVALQAYIDPNVFSAWRQPGWK
jgi:DNA topoisomerase-1